MVESCPSLKIVVPKDASTPNGVAVESGALLSASELHARGHFVNSPSDTAPTQATLVEKTKGNDDDQLKGRCSKTRDSGSKKASSTRAAGLDNDINSGDESDGRNALRGVEVWEEPTVVACHGPGNASIKQVCNISMSRQ